jgi:hypothetical protein
VNPCQRCSALWRDCALWLAEISRLSAAVEDIARRNCEPTPELLAELYFASTEAAAIEAKIHIHDVLAHGRTLGLDMPVFRAAGGSAN